MEPLFVPAGHMTARQVADTLGIGLPGVRKLVQRGQLARAGGSQRQPYYDTEQVLALWRDREAA
ncbi:helix-turn-helix domain-containing protein [Actinacidiphila epipremni]|uniref:Helix-turn-helix domain-containing protein n=1 Tax=Actinacidiphila epipremni TaxID=2053013 RepID=A0ABX0ZK91_9ACTN|nr:helix-turn-helix domain-containing protein [Actinacidiphila epipremni]NJP42284.1 helix-turn-helix domain-containing protein [Actinacidiphila epipremni]